MVPGIWVTNGGNIVYTPFDTAFAIAEVEGDGDYDGLMLAIANDALPDCPLAIITDYTGIEVKSADGSTDIEASKARSAPIAEAGFACVSEVYLRTDAGQPTGKTLESMEHKAIQIGLPRPQPVFGAFGGVTLADYAQWQHEAGWSTWLAEFVL